MEKQKITLEQIQGIARLIRQVPAITAKTREEVLEQYLSRMLLLMGSSPMGATFREMHKNFLDDMEPFTKRRISNTYTFLDFFNANGPATRFIKEDGNMKRLMDTMQGPVENRQAILHAYVDALPDFNYRPYKNQRELAYLSSFMAEVQNSAMRIIPWTFREYNQPGGLPAIMTQYHNCIEEIGKIGSGIYEDRSRPFNDDGSVQWMIVLKRSVPQEGNYSVDVMYIFHQDGMTQLFVHHPQENTWVTWDGHHLIQGMVQALVEEYAWLCTLYIVSTNHDDWYKQQLDVILRSNRKYMWQHDVLHPAMVFNHLEGKDQECYADFSHAENTCRLTVRTKSVWMIIYANKIKGNWEQDVRYMLPQQPHALQSYPVDEESLTMTQKLVLLQRAFRALSKKQDLIQYEQTKQHQERNAA